MVAVALAVGCGDSLAADRIDAGGRAPDAAGLADAGAPDAGHELTCTPYAGGGTVCEGSYSIANPDDLRGISGCGEITGNLLISAPGMTAIALPALTRVAGDLTVTGNTTLVSLDLSALAEVGGWLTIEQLDDLDVSGLVTGGAGIFVGDVAFPCLEEVTGALAGGAIDIPRLRTAGGLQASTTAPALETVGWLDGDLSLPVLVSVEDTIDDGGAIDAPRLETVGRDVRTSIIRAPLLTAVGGELQYWDGTEVPALERVGRLVLEDPAAIDLPALREITGTLVAGDLPAAYVDPTAAALDLPALESAGAIRLCLDDWALAELSMPSLQRVTGAADPSYPDAVFLVGACAAAVPAGAPSMIDLPSLTGIAGGAVRLRSAATAPVLSRVDGLLDVTAPLSAPALVEVTGVLWVAAPLSADALAAVGGLLVATRSLSLPALTSADGVRLEGGQVTSVDLTSLLAVAGTSGVPGSGDIVVQDDGVTGALTLPALTSVPGEVVVRRSPWLTGIAAPGLAAMGGSLQLSRNVSLSDIDFAALADLGASLTIVNNTSLPTCQATALDDQLRAGGWSGTTTISGNGAGSCP